MGSGIDYKRIGPARFDPSGAGQAGAGGHRRKEGFMTTQSKFSPPRIFGTVLFAVLLVGGCTSTNLEFDRMTGTAYPPEQTVGGDTVNLGTIYANAGHLLIVDEDDTDIAPLTVGDGTQQQCVNTAELSSIEAGNRSTQIGPASFECGFWIFTTTCTRYHLYGVVTDHNYEFDNGTCSTGIMGIMYDAVNRGAFAVFYKNNTIKNNGAKYLRSAAHEIGHAFNLHHSDGDGSTTIMNQTKVVGDTFVYEFSDQSQTHLDDHPDNCKYPGTGSFTSVNEEHADWHDGVSATCA